MLFLQMAICCSQEEIHKQLSDIFPQKGEDSSDGSSDESGLEAIPKKGRSCQHFFMIVVELNFKCKWLCYIITVMRCVKVGEIWLVYLNPF